jgi:hypothetical protein
LAEASKFLEAALTEFPVANTSGARRSRALSEEVRRQFWLPGEMLDAIYSEPVVQHFYSRDEIAAFKRSWMRRNPSVTSGEDIWGKIEKAKAVMPSVSNA